MKNNRNNDIAIADLKWSKVLLSDWLKNQTHWLALAQQENLLLALVIVGEDELGFDSSAIQAIDTIIIEFSDVMDGRGFSQAAILREKLHFEGRIHALNTLEDNIPFMRQCGFTSFELSNGEVFNCDTQTEEQADSSPVGFANQLSRLKFV